MNELDGRALTLERDVDVVNMCCASKSDLAEAKADILVKVAETENTLRTDINGVRQELRTEITQAKNSLLFWVVTSVFLVHFLPDMLSKLGLV